ncbi:MAG: 30S ribosome-binding factor RbfA [Gemmataceae bacterium]|nr:30S ribosome-binding factor RbfA [Gemmataceae bacterium]
MHTTLFRVPSPYPGRLAVAPRPRGGDWLADEMAGWRAAGVGTVVSLLTPGEAAEFDLGGERDAAGAAGMRFVALPVEDRGTPPDREAFRAVVEDVAGELVAGRGVVVHCRQGIGRAGMVAVGTLVAAGLTADEAIARVGAARGRPIPETPAQRRWLDEFAAGWDGSGERGGGLPPPVPRTPKLGAPAPRSPGSSTPMKSHRLARVSEVVREAAANAILFEIKDPRVKGVTVTRAEVTADLQHAKVYVSVMGTEKQQKATMHGLRSAAGYIQTKVADRLTTRYVPHVTFVLDEGVKKSIAIAQLIRDEMATIRPDPDAAGEAAAVAGADEADGHDEDDEDSEGDDASGPPKPADHQPGPADGPADPPG